MDQNGLKAAPNGVKTASNGIERHRTASNGF
jgi:hypothetical protein